MQFKNKKTHPEEKFPELIPLWIAVFIDILGFSVIIPLLPYLTDEWGISGTQIGFVLSINAIFGLFFGPLWGKLSDLLGRKKTLLICQFGTLAAFILVAFSKNYTMLIIARVVDGIFGGNFPIAKAIIGDIIPPKRRAIYLSNIGVAHILSSVVAPAIGGFLAFTGLFGLGLISSALCIITITLTFIKLRETNPIYLKRKKHEEDNNIISALTVFSIIREVFTPKHTGFLKKKQAGCVFTYPMAFSHHFFLYLYIHNHVICENQFKYGH